MTGCDDAKQIHEIGCGHVWWPKRSVDGKRWIGDWHGNRIAPGIPCDPSGTRYQFSERWENDHRPEAFMPPKVDAS